MTLIRNSRTKVGLLDLIPNAMFAVSLRQLRADYNNNIYRYRRSSDNTEDNVSIDNWGNFDANKLHRDISSNSAYCPVWYDQSGNARDAKQTATGNQPRLVNSGAIDKVGGKSGVNFIASNTTRLKTDVSTFLDNLAALTIYARVYYKAFVSAEMICARHVGGTNGSFFVDFESADTVSFTTINTTPTRKIVSKSISSELLNTWIDIIARYDGTNMCVFVNCVKSANVGQTGLLQNSGNLYIGVYDNTGFPLNRHLNTLVLWNRALTDAEIANISNIMAGGGA